MTLLRQRVTDSNSPGASSLISPRPVRQTRTSCGAASSESSYIPRSRSACGKPSTHSTEVGSTEPRRAKTNLQVKVEGATFESEVDYGYQDSAPLQTQRTIKSCPLATNSASLSLRLRHRTFETESFESFECSRVVNDQVIGFSDVRRDDHSSIRAIVDVKKYNRRQRHDKQCFISISMATIALATVTVTNRCEIPRAHCPNLVGVYELFSP